MSDKDEANTVLALELDEKVRQRVEQVLLDPMVVNTMYSVLIQNRLLYSRGDLLILAERLHVLEKEFRFNSANNYPWRF